MARKPDRLRFGWLADQRLAWTALLDTARTVERLGYDSLWVSDHFIDERGRWFLDAWTTLGAVLACVPRVEAGLLVASNSMRSPLVTAHMTSTLTDIGAGRFVLGLGAGGSRREHLDAGVGFPRLDDRVAALDATCHMIRGTSPHDMSEAGKQPTPNPDSPPVTLLIGGTGDRVLRVAARHADRWAVWGTPNDLAALGETLSQYAHEAGRNPYDIRRGAIVMLLPEHLPERSDPAPWPAELRGGQSGIAAQLARYQEAGVSDVIVCDYGLAPSARLAALEWLALVMAPFRAPSW